MDDQNFDPNELAALRGGRKADPVKKDAFEPAKSKMPTKKGTGIPPLVPIVSGEDIYKYMEEKKEPEDAYAFEKHGTFDPELNELALQEVAAERGITVEELLASQGKKLKKKLEPATMDNNEKGVTMDASALKKALEQMAEPKKEAAPEAEPADDIDLELQALELKKQELELKRKKAAEEAQKIRDQREKELKKASEEQVRKKVSNPVIERMRQKLSLDVIKPSSVELEGIKFELLPPPAGVHPWIIEKIKLASDMGEETLVITVKITTVAASIIRIEGVPVAEVLGLVPEGSTVNPLNPSIEQRLLSAQTIWEMISGTSTIEGLFSFSPQVVLKLYEAYQLAFKDQEIASSLDADAHRFVCEVEGCPEQYNHHPETKESKFVFCRAHGIPMKDLGPVRELKSLPLV